ncbi:MAG TPA: hypothetical protein PLV45_04535, partial [bacterium]|nr:hypothetical protein [bacterium]
MPTVRNSVIRNNTAELFGGGLAMSDGGSVINCDIIDNTALGSGSIAGSGGGICTWYETHPFVIDACRFTGNSAEHAGAVSVNFSNVLITRSEFTGNSAYLGGAISARTPTVTIGGQPGMENIFVQNRAAVGADLFSLSTVEVINAQYNIFAGNHTSEYYVYSPDRFDLTGSISSLLLITQDVYVAVDG